MSTDLEKSGAEVIEGELIVRPGDALAPGPTSQGSTPQNLVGRIVRRSPAQVVTTLAKHRRTQAVTTKAGPPARATARLIWTTMQGYRSWLKRAHDAATHGAYREQVRVARAAHNPAAVNEALDRLKDAKRIRSTLLKDLPGVVLGLVRVVALTLVLLGFVLVLLGLTIQLTPGGWGWSDWWSVLGGMVTTLGDVFYAAVVLALWIAVPLLLLTGHAEGKRAGTRPRWLVTEVERAELDSVIDERMVSLALANLGIAALTAFFKNGGRLEYIDMPRTDGDGAFTRINLPLGVTAEMIADQRGKLAGNLRRASLETWPTKGEEDGILDLWVANKGVLTAGAGGWPLQHDGAVDVFEGVPFGRSQRGDVVNAPLFETNWLIGGRPGQGKSAAMRTLLLGAALDPTAELWAFVMGESPDFKPFEPRLSRYRMGMDDGVAADAVQALRDLLVEMERRGKLLGQQPGSPPKTSRKLANKAALGLHLLVCAIDEVHELFMHPKYGKEACELAVRLIKRGRKYGIVLILATQSPTKDSIPREVTRNVGCGVAFCVADHVANDGLLGSGKYKAGIRATELRFNVDRGTCVTVGITDATFELIRTFYIPFEDGRDDVTPIIARAMEGAELRHTGRAAAALEAVVAGPDHLGDVAEAMRGEARLRTAVLLGRLIERDADYYEPWGFQDLSQALDDEGVPIRKSGGNSVVRLEDVQEALSGRASEMLNDLP